MSKQDTLIGTHPEPPNIIGRWLNSINHPENTHQCHRSLSETGTLDETELLDWLSDHIIHYHYYDNQIEDLKSKYSKLGFNEYAENIRMIPNADKVRKGNMTEIILSEYIINSTNKPLIKTHRFRYSPNVDQSMKGDDVLMVDYNDTSNDIEVHLGEAKFRQTPNAKAVRDIANSLARDTKPLSFTFLVQNLINSSSTEAIGRRLNKFVVETIRRQGKITYSGLLLGNAKSSNTVQNNLNSDNPKLVFLSLAVENPNEFLEKVFTRVEHKLANPKTI